MKFTFCIVLFIVTVSNDGLYLTTAARKGNIQEIKEILARGADVDARDNITETALIKASRNGHLKIVKLLISNKADVNARSDYGLTSLIEASFHGHEKIVRLLIEHGAKVNARVKDGRTALICASGNSRYRKGFPGIVKLLLKNGANVNWTTTSDESALYRAVIYSQADITKMLLEKGAGRDELATLYMIAENRKDEKIIKLLRPYYDSLRSRTVDTKRYNKDLDPRIFTVPGQVRANIHRYPEKYIKKLVLYLTGDTKDPFLKVKRINDWIVYNFKYDKQRANRAIAGKAIRYYYWDTLKKRSGICDDFAALVEKMCTIAGIKAMSVDGHLKARRDAGHAWNAVMIKRNWYFIDVTQNRAYYERFKEMKGVNLFMTREECRKYYEFNKALTERFGF